MPLRKLSLVSLPKLLKMLGAHGSKPNKYKPHQGKREVARRLRRIKGES